MKKKNGVTDGRVVDQNTYNDEQVVGSYVPLPIRIGCQGVPDPLELDEVVPGLWLLPIYSNVREGVVEPISKPCVHGRLNRLRHSLSPNGDVLVRNEDVLNPDGDV